MQPPSSRPSGKKCFNPKFILFIRSQIWWSVVFLFRFLSTLPQKLFEWLFWLIDKGLRRSTAASTPWRENTESCSDFRSTNTNLNAHCKREATNWPRKKNYSGYTFNPFFPSNISPSRKKAFITERDPTMNWFRLLFSFEGSHRHPHHVEFWMEFSFFRYHVQHISLQSRGEGEALRCFNAFDMRTARAKHSTSSQSVSKQIDFRSHWFFDSLMKSDNLHFSVLCHALVMQPFSGNLSCHAISRTKSFELSKRAFESLSWNFKYLSAGRPVLIKINVRQWRKFIAKQTEESKCCENIFI